MRDPAVRRGDVVITWDWSENKTALVFFARVCRGREHMAEAERVRLGAAHELGTYRGSRKWQIDQQLEDSLGYPSGPRFAGSQTEIMEYIKDHYPPAPHTRSPMQRARRIQI